MNWKCLIAVYSWKVRTGNKNVKQYISNETCVKFPRSKAMNWSSLCLLYTRIAYMCNKVYVVEKILNENDAKMGIKMGDSYQNKEEVYGLKAQIN